MWEWCVLFCNVLNWCLEVLESALLNLCDQFGVEFVGSWCFVCYYDVVGLLSVCDDGFDVYWY